MGPLPIPCWVAPLLAGLSLASSVAACITLMADGAGPGVDGNVAAVRAVPGDEAPGRVGAAAEAAGAAPPLLAPADPRPVAGSCAAASCQTGLSVDLTALDSD